MHSRLVLRGAAAGAGLAAALQVGPAASWLPVVRTRLPGLAGEGAGDHVALTFDDGPDPRSTPRFLEALADLDVHATFFVLGDRLRRYPECAQAAVAAGHEIAVHGWDHGYQLLTPPWSGQLRRCAALVAEVTGRWPRWFRPPYGVFTLGGAIAARRAALRPVLWTAWGRDWAADATPTSILATIGPGVRGGATLLLHDCDCTSAPGAWRNTLAALPEVVGRCRAAGLEVGRLDDHLCSVGWTRPAL